VSVSQLVTTVLVGGDPFPVSDVRLVLDDGWSPRCAATFTVPYAPDYPMLLDPRNHVRATITIERFWWGAGATLDDLSDEWYEPATPPATVLRTNLFPNPSVETNLTGYLGQRVAVTRPAGTWGAGGFVLRATPNVVGQPGSYVFARPGGATNPYLPGHTYTVIVTAHMDAPLTGTLDASIARRVVVYTSVGLIAGTAAFPNVAGTYPLRLTFTMPSTAYTTSDIRLGVGASSGGGYIDFDKLEVWEGPDDGREYFDGDTPDTTDREYAWTGTPHASTSTESTVYDPGFTLDDLTARWGPTTTLDDLTELWIIDWGNGARPTDGITADLIVRERTVNHAAATISVRATSDELLAQDAHVAVVRPLEPLPDRLMALLAAGHVPLGPLPDFSAGEGFTMPDQSVEASQSIWDAMQANTTHAGLRLWCDEARVWRLAVPEPAPTTSVDLLRVIDCTDAVNTDGDYADVYVFVGKGIATGLEEPNTPLTETVTYPETIPAGPYKAHVEEHDFGEVGVGLPMPTADELALRLAKLQARAQVLTITATADPSIRPGVGVVTGAPSLPPKSSTVSRVEWSIPADVMVLTTRSTVEA
jgi:hypothetical protein